MKRTLLAAIAAFVVLASVPASLGATTNGAQKAREIDLTGTVDPLIAKTVERGIARASRDHSSLVIVRIDTPGGLSSSMRDIVQAIAASNSPVVCWVGPIGARAASAGAIILLGCPVAAMAPGTNVGAAHPVGITGGIMSEKVTNDAAAYARALAQRWNRNATWAESAVRDSVSVSAEDALKLHVIDLIAPSLGDLLVALNGRVVKTASGDVAIPSLSTRDLAVIRPTIAEAIFHGLIDPNLAFLFFLVGIAGIVFEVLHPGFSVPAIIGILLLIASFIMLGMLPVNVGGLLLLLASMVIFVVDLHRPSHGIGTVIAIVTMVLGGLFLFDSSVPNAHVSRWLIAGTALAMAAFFSLIVRAVLAARHMPKPAHLGPAPGTEGVVVRDLDPTGAIRAGGEEWSAVSDGGSIRVGTPVRVVSTVGLTVHVMELVGQGEKK
ncbi:MAG: NfeD family protein [Actinomycetota bacterium]